MRGGRILIIKRNFEKLIRDLLGHFPVVTILGARQSGKTTLAKQVAPDWQYIDIEKPSDYERLMHDPEFFFNQYPDHVIIDEAQRAPKLFEALRGIIDRKRHQKGRFIITGSSSPELQNQISETLAGRIAIVELSTLKTNEYCQKPISKFYKLFENRLSKKSLEIISNQKKLPLKKVQHIWLYGGYPEPLLSNDQNFYNLWMKGYFDAYINRDIAKLFPQLNSLAYQRFVSMLCYLSGTILNRSEVARSLSVSEKSVRDYLQIISGTFLWRELPSFEKSKIKTIIKMPRGHIRDSGLLHYLLNIDSLEKLYRHPIIGRSFEGFVIEEILKGLSAIKTTNWKAYYYRTRHGVEIDLILEGRFGIIPIEIKHGSYVKISQLSNLENFIIDHNLPFGLLVNQAEKPCWLTANIFQIPISYL